MKGASLVKPYFDIRICDFTGDFYLYFIGKKTPETFPQTSNVTLEAFCKFRGH